MAHEIDQTTGQAAVFVTGEPAWHRLGTVIEQATSSAEAIGLAGLDWHVEQWPVRAFDPHQFGSEARIDEFVANVRTDTRAVIGVVGKRYRVFQNREAFDFMDALVGDKLAMYETAGSLHGGRRVWMLAQRFAAGRFTDAYSRLARIGRRLAQDDVRHRFIEHLTELDPRMASVILAAAPIKYRPDTRGNVTQSLAQSISSRHRVHATFAIAMLGKMDCPESSHVLAQYLLPPADPHRFLKVIGARAFAKLGYAAAAEFVYRWSLFGGRAPGNAYYFREDLVMLRQAKPELRDALAKYAIGELKFPSGEMRHTWAVYVLASLGDNRLVEHLKQRFTTNGLLHNYENHALIAVGNDAAGSLFAQSVEAVVSKLSETPSNDASNDARNDLYSRVYFYGLDVRYLITPAFEPHLRRLIESDSPEALNVACDLVKRAWVTSLFYVLAANSKQHIAFFADPFGNERDAVASELWLPWWHKTADAPTRRRLLDLAPRCPSVEIETILLECLDTKELRQPAAKLLGEYGAASSTTSLRQILTEGSGADAGWDKMAAANAIGDLRDNGAILPLKDVISAYPNSLVSRAAATSIGLIGTPEAEAALGSV